MHETTKIKEKQTALHKIDCYGSHLGLFKAAINRFTLSLYWSEYHTQKSLKEYYIDWAKQNDVLDVTYDFPKGFEDFFLNLKSLKKANPIYFASTNNRHLIQIIDTFERNNNQLGPIFRSYCDLAIASEQSLDDFITAVNESLISGSTKDIKECMDKFSRSGIQRANLILYNGFILETARVLWRHVYYAFPIINLYLNALTGSMFFPGFWGFFCVGILASFTLEILGPGFKGAWNKVSIAGAVTAIAEAWKEKVKDENSFHPLLEIFIRSFYCAVTWLYIDELEKAVKTGDFILAFSYWGIKNFALKYSTTDFFFFLKAAFHKGNLAADSTFYSSGGIVCIGFIRGIIRNALAEYLGLATCRSLVKDVGDIFLINLSLLVKLILSNTSIVKEPKYYLPLIVLVISIFA